MRRIIFIIALLALAALLPQFIMAGDVPHALSVPQFPQPQTTEEPPAPPADAPPPVSQAPQVEPIPTAASLSPFDPDSLRLLIDIRTDLELMVTQNLNGARPNGWSGSLDTGNPQLPLLMRLDLELLTGTLLGAYERPVGWFGAVPSTTYAIIRDIRHDLEVLADTVYGVNIRPPGWVGADPLLRCGRAVQALVLLLERGGGFTLSVQANDPDFCQKVEVETARFAEANLLNSQQAVAINSAAPGSIRVNGQFAVAFLNRYGTDPVGTVPIGEVVEPIARSYTQFSRMMLVRGSGFEVFMDYRDTTMTEAQFLALPDVTTTGSNPACTASWCKATAAG